MVSHSTNVKQTNGYLSPQVVKHKICSIYVDGNPGPGLGQAQKCGRVKLVNVAGLNLLMWQG